MKNIFLKIAYDGSSYKGWQKQKDVKTVAGVLEDAINGLLKTNIRLIGASRTDAGVHAKGQCANFLLPIDVEPKTIKHVLNQSLPKDIIILDVEEKDEDFSSRFNAKGKHYRYVINTAKEYSPFTSRYSLHYPKRLDVESMADAAGVFIGEKDFASLAASSKQEVNTVRHITEITVTKDKDEIYIDVFGTSFLYKMVRTIAGLLVDVGRGAKTTSDVEDILEAKDRNLAGKSLAGCGLFLMKVYY